MRSPSNETLFGDPGHAMRMYVVGYSTASRMQTRSLFKMGDLFRRLKPRRLWGLAEAPTRFFVLLFLTLLLLVICSGVYQRSNKAYIDNPNE
jgi:hypothetical protein